MRLRILVASMLALATISVSAFAEPTPPSSPHKLTMEAARKVALAKVPGTVKHEELEKEKGRWIYSFEIRPKGGKAGSIKEVNVDADSGSVVSVEDESEDDDDEEEERESPRR